MQRSLHSRPRENCFWVCAMLESGVSHRSREVHRQIILYEIYILVYHTYQYTKVLFLEICYGDHNTSSPAIILKKGSTKRVPSTKFTTSSTTLIFSVSTTAISKSPSRRWIRSTSD